MVSTVLIGFLANFKYGLLPSNSCSSLNIGFVQRTITKMADKMVATYQFALGHSNSVIFNQISFKLNIWIAPIKLSFKYEYGLCPKNDLQDG